MEKDILIEEALRLSIAKVLEYRVDKYEVELIADHLIANGIGDITAEMLLWLAENESIDIWHTASKEIVSVWRNGNAVMFKGKTLSEAIKQAYDWAKQRQHF